MRAWSRWQRAAGPWQGWTQCPTLLSPAATDVEPRPARNARRAAALVRQLSQTLSGGAACVLDLEPSLGVRVAAQLSGMRLAHPVLVLPRWPYVEAVLPSDRLLEVLVSEADRLATVARRLGNVVFVLDGERSTLLPERPPDDSRADNRHTLSIFDLPNLATLRARGIHRIVRVVSTSSAA